MVFIFLLIGLFFATCIFVVEKIVCKLLKSLRKKSKKEVGQQSIDKYFKEECEGDNRIQVENNENPTPKTSARNRSPPSTSKAPAKCHNTAHSQRMNSSGTDDSDSDSDSSVLSDTSKHDEDNMPIHSNPPIALSTEYELLKNVLQEELDGIFDTKLESKLSAFIAPLQNSISTLLNSDKEEQLHTRKVDDLRRINQSLKLKCCKIEKENGELKLKLRNIELKLLENNLIFQGIPEDPWEKVSTTHDKIYDALSNQMTGDSREKLKKAKKIPIINVKRKGRYNQQHPRPISVTFSNQLDIESIMDKKKKLKKGIYVDYEYDDETNRNRKLLYPILKAARNMKDYQGKCKLEGDVLTLQGKKYTTQNIGSLPAELNGFKVSSRSNDDTYAFFGELNPFSNFHPCKFEVNGITYNSSEQFIQSEKARYYGDTTAEEKILESVTALETKQIGKTIKNNQESIGWKEVAKELCMKGLEAKFAQNKELMILLLSTNDQTLVESSYDELWGTGLPLQDSNCLNREHWNNIGILGEMLMEVRSKYLVSKDDFMGQNIQSEPVVNAMTSQNMT